MCAASNKHTPWWLDQSGHIISVHMPTNSIANSYSRIMQMEQTLRIEKIDNSCVKEDSFTLYHIAMPIFVFNYMLGCKCHSCKSRDRKPAPSFPLDFPSRRGFAPRLT